VIVDPFAMPEPGDGEAAAVYEGPFERTPWPSQLVAHVVSPGDSDDRRIAGYAVAADLARYHGIADVAWLALRGELPDATQREALDTALVLMAPVHVGEAPTHAAYLARLAGGPEAATVAVGALALSEQVAGERHELAAWLAWLDAPEGPVPEVARLAAVSATWRASQAALSTRLRRWFGDAGALPEVPLRRLACAHAILFRLGVREPLALETLAVWARLPAVIAEAAFARAGVVRDFPTRLPDYQYVDDHGASP
jgi:hypothetical protein